jgi:serine/threonine protein kinase
MWKEYAMQTEDMKTLGPQRPAGSKWRPATESEGRNLFRPGEIIGAGWKVIEFISRGGIGEVYLAQNLRGYIRAAVKVISHKSLRLISANNQEFENCVERFRREFKTIAEINHPNVIVGYDYGYMLINRRGHSDQIEYIAMEYLNGATLRSTISESGFYPNEERIRDWLTRYYLPLLDGVIALHEMGIILHDLKPDNVLLDAEVPKIAYSRPDRSQHVGRVAKINQLKGSPSYMSPENFGDLERTDERSDVFSLGIILAEAISGKRMYPDLPFKTVQLRAPAIPARPLLQKLDIPATPFLQKLDLIIQDSTHELKQMRFASVKDLKENLESMLLDSGSVTMPLPNVQRGSVRGLKTTPLYIALILSAIIFILILRLFIRI